MATVIEQIGVFDGILTQCRDLVCGRLDQAIAGMLDKTDEVLTALAVKSQDREAQKLYLEAMNVARAQRATIEKLFRARYLSEFQQRTNRVKKIGRSFSDVDISSLDLELVADDDLNETLKFNDMAAKLRRYCEEEIVALDQRVGVLLGDAGVQSEDNPFSPQAICNAYKHTCRQVDANVNVRLIFLKLFDDHVLDSIRSVYKSVNELLVQNSILPKIRYGVSRREGGKAPSRADAGEASAGEQDIFAVLQKLLISNAGAMAQPSTAALAGLPPGVPGTQPIQTVLQEAELLDSLTRIQLGDLSAVATDGTALPVGTAEAATTNVLRQLKGTSVAASMGQMDSMTLDIVAMLFDQLFDDPKIPLGAKGLIGRMQIPVLKVAIADKAFFSKKTHPARDLLDTLGEIALRLPADFNASSALFGPLKTILEELINGFEDNVEIFDVIRERLLALMAEEDQRVEQETRSAAERIIQEETLAVAKIVAQEEIRTRIQVHQLPGPVLEFLVEQWLKLLLIIYVKRGESSDPWKNALDAVDQLIWSVQPKDSLEDRRKLAMMVPALLKRISAGLQVAGIEDGIRERFFADLMRYHTKVMGSAAKGKPAAAPSAEAWQVAAESNAAPAAPGFTTSITVKNPFGGGEVQVGELDVVAPATPDTSLPAGATAETDLPASLKQGAWIEFQESDKDTRRPARLIFVSPRKTRYIFCDRSEKNYIECTRSEIARRLHSGEAIIMDEVPEVPLFERVMAGVVSKLRAAAAPR